MIATLADLAMLAAMPFVLLGALGRVKSLWSGRKGPPILQPAFDALRLMRKSSVYSTTSTPLFRIAPLAYLATAVGSALIAPLAGSRPIASFPFDFVWLAYAWGLGRIAVMLAALDVGSSFEGMGAAREATFSTLVEPCIFLVVGALCLLGDVDSLQAAVCQHAHGIGATVAWGAAVAALLIVLQVEASRIPVDDPATHLELTMVHEVMALDHSGPELAAIQVASAVKLLVATSLVATLLNPLRGDAGALAAIVQLGLCLAVAIAVGTIESLIARLKLRAVPRYIAVATAAGLVALVAAALRGGGAA